jgi:hypothetical protein
MTVSWYRWKVRRDQEVLVNGTFIKWFDRLKNMATGATGIHCMALTKPSVATLQILLCVLCNCWDVQVTKITTPSVQPTMIAI